jgi:YHS domain-containing protein
MVRRIARLLVPAFALALLTTGEGSAAFAQANPKGGKQGNPGGSSKTDPNNKQTEPKKVTEKVTTVFFGNEKCLCGKAADHDKSVDVDGQKIYVCSDACAATVKKGDLKAELAKAYPGTTDVMAKGCPTCGKAVTAAKEVVFQGRKAKLCCDNCAAEFKKDPGLYLAKATWPDAKDAKNANDPIDGKPVTPGVVAICKNHIVHFSSAKSVAAFEKDPTAAMTKLKLD